MATYDQPGVESTKTCGKYRHCDPTPNAYKIAEAKARGRAQDTRSPTYLLRARELERHLGAIENAKAVVDCGPPMVAKMQYHRLHASNMSGLLHAKIEVNNAQLLSRLASIYSGRSKVSVNTRLNESVRATNRYKMYSRAMKTMQLMNENLRKYESLRQTKATYSTAEMAKWYAVHRKYKDRMCKFPDIAKPKACPLYHRRVMEKSLTTPRQYAYLLVEVEDKQAVNLVIELFADLCPFTVKNFQKLCTNTKATACDCRTYRCKRIDRLHCVQTVDGRFKKIYWVVGEHIDSTVEYTPFMLKECSTIPHSEAGLVTRPKGRAGGVFFITIGPCRHLDQFCYVFGKIVGDGLEFLKKMEQKNIEENGQPIISMHVTDCGVVKRIDEVPPPMMLQDFISQVRHEIMPFIKRNPEKPGEWMGGKSTFADILKERAEEKLTKFEDTMRATADVIEEEDDDEQ